MYWLRRLFRKEQAEKQLDAELRFHLERQVADYIAAGMNPDEARRRARLEFGAPEGIKEDCRESRRANWIDTLLQDLNFGLRILRKNPGFTVVAVLTLGLGIGANTAIFTVLNSVILRPLPYRDPSRLALVWTGSDQNPQARFPASGPQLTYLHEHNRLFEDIGAIWASTGTLTGLAEPEQLKVGNVTSNFFQVFGVTPQLGRDFAESDQHKGAAPALILSDSLWRTHFAADPGVIGRSARYQGGLCTIVGVMPHDFQLIFPSDASVPPDLQAWTPFPYDLHQLPRDLGFLRVIARLHPGVTSAQAQSELDAIAGELRSQFTEFATQATTMRLAPLHEDSVREVRTMLFSLFGGVSMILLIACANVANLFLGRATARRREITLRAALGAARSRIVRQLLTESLLLSFAGAAAGLGIAWTTLQLLLALRPGNVARLQTIHLDLASFGFACVAAIVTGILFGLAPVLATSKLNLVETLKEGSRGASSRKHLPQRVLVVSEVALGLVLLIGATGTDVPRG